MGFDVLDTGFIGCLTTEEGGGGGSSCIDPEVIFNGLALTLENIGGCDYKPILKATSLTHSLTSDDDLTFHVNCTMVGANAPMGGVSCAGGSNFSNDDLQYGINFTKAELLAGIDLNSYDSINADTITDTGTTTSVWLVRVISFNNDGCNTGGGFICIDYGAGAGDGIQDFTGYLYADNGPSLYTDGSGTYPQFATYNAATVGVDIGTTYDNIIQVDANVEYYAWPTSMGYDSFGATDFKIEIQYDTSCNTSGGCGSYSWVDGIDNDTYLAAGDGGAGYEQTFDVVEEDCWTEDYIYVRYRIVAQGSCGGGTTNGAWTDAYLGEFDVDAATVQCSGGGGGGGGGSGSYAYTLTLDLEDTYGDGWGDGYGNNPRLEVIEGTTSLGYAMVESGYTTTFYIETDDVDSIKIVWDYDSYNSGATYEQEAELYADDGTTLLSSWDSLDEVEDGEVFHSQTNTTNQTTTGTLYEES